jgi:isopentenyl-diphosphate delta-isomerase
LGVCKQLPVINNNEVLDYKYIDYNTLNKDVLENPENYTAWFLKIYDQVNQRFIDLKRI